MSDTQATSNFRLSLKAKINIGIVAYIVVAFSMLGWTYSARDDYKKARREAERSARVELRPNFMRSIGLEPSPGNDGPTRTRVVDYPPKPLILRVEDGIVIAVLGAFIGSGWLGLQLLAILFRNTLRMGARAISDGKAEAAERRSTSTEVTVED